MQMNLEKHKYFTKFAKDALEHMELTKEEDNVNIMIAITPDKSLKFEIEDEDEDGDAEVMMPMGNGVTDALDDGFAMKTLINFFHAEQIGASITIQPLETYGEVVAIKSLETHGEAVVEDISAKALHGHQSDPYAIGAFNGKPPEGKSFAKASNEVVNNPLTPEGRNASGKSRLASTNRVNNPLTADGRVLEGQRNVDVGNDSDGNPMSSAQVDSDSRLASVALPRLVPHAEEDGNGPESCGGKRDDEYDYNDDDDNDDDHDAAAVSFSILLPLLDGHLDGLALLDLDDGFFTIFIIFTISDEDACK